MTLDEERALVHDAKGTLTRITIEKFVDQHSRTVLQQCIWNRMERVLVCKGMRSEQKPIRYEAMPFRTTSGKEKFTIPIESGTAEQTITAPVGAQRIQAALAKKGIMHASRCLFCLQGELP